MGGVVIFLDMDGVLCDFVKSACALHGQPVESVDCWDFNNKWGITGDELWAPIHEAGAEWWADLEPYPWCHELISVVADADPNFVICTTPSASPGSCAGKLEWLHRHLGPKFRRYIMACDKSPLAANGRLLIDDGDHNCLAFQERGGDFICVPQPWNSNAEHVERRMEHVCEFLSHYRGLVA
jgi:5'(3')-deoxyribonucleotidase